MAAGQHRPSCAARQRARARVEGWGIQQVVDSITGCCGVSPLRAQRLARGWTLEQAAERLRALVADQIHGPRADSDQLRLWETHPTRRPQARTIDLLCRLYETDAQHLGMAGDYRSQAAPAPDRRLVPTKLRASHEPVPVTAGDPFDQLVESARRAVDRTLVAATVSAAQLDLLDQRVLWHRHQYMTTAPRTMLELLLADLAEVHELAAER
ncbi:hypothetical protein [Streptacidiphilus albus]|uniref:hypothetical protein n=1 Tax=Streptacidiphilus albus TaxID=105425 RepID=UPI00128BE305|nr:hypothetical protein [Streptacidiphilus albus]